MQEHEPWWSSYALTAFSTFMLVVADVLRRGIDRRFRRAEDDEYEDEEEEPKHHHHRRYHDEYDDNEPDGESLP